MDQAHAMAAQSMQYPMSPNAQSMEQGTGAARRNEWFFE